MRDASYLKHIVAVSGGKDSTAMAIRLAELHPKRRFEYVCTPTGNELPEMEEHWGVLEGVLDAPIIRLKVFEGDGLEAVIRQEGMLPNFRARFCTRILKIEPMLKYLEEAAPAIHYVGLRADEPEREGIYGNVSGVRHAYPMREWNWDIEAVWDYLEDKDIRIPRRTDCGLCFFQRLTEWKYLLENQPELYKQGVRLEQEMGHTFRSPSRDRWPADLAGLQVEFESGRELRGWKTYVQRLQSDCDREALCRVCSM